MSLDINRIEKVKNYIIQTCIPDYRVKVYNYTIEKNNTVTVLSGREYYTPSIKSVNGVVSVEWVDNLFFYKRKFLLQKLPWKKVLKAENVIIEFNLRNISFYVVLFSRFLLRKKTFLWGHAWSRSGKQSKSEIIRKFFKKIASGYIAYTNKQANELREQLPNKKVFSANNSIYYRSEMEPLYKDLNSVVNFIYVGRLVREKKPLFMIKAFHSALNELPKNINLLVIGSGPEKENIEKYIVNNNLKNRVRLLGHISNYQELRKIYSTAIASVSPGYVGLSITQSLGFGIPMIISKSEKHSPELEAAVIGFNSEYFKTDSLESLKKAYLSFYSSKSEWFTKRKEISKRCMNTYSVEKMAEPFLEVFKMQES